MDIDLVKAWAKANGITQKELAERLGVTEVSVSNWMTGRRNMSPAVKVALSLLMRGGEPEQAPEPVEDWLIQFDEDVWRRLKQEADKHGITPQEMATKLACRLADALAEQWCKMHHEREAQYAEAKQNMPELPNYGEAREPFA